MSGLTSPINFRPLACTRIFRSSQPEDSTTSQVFVDAGIGTILDLRDRSEVVKQQGCEHFRLYEALQLRLRCSFIHYNYSYVVLSSITITVPKFAKAGTAVITKPVVLESGWKVAPSCGSGVYEGVHIILPIMKRNGLIKFAPWWQKIIIVLAYIYDLIFRTNHVRKLVIKWIMNKEGENCLVWLYKYFLDFNGQRIYNALQVVSQLSDKSAVIICAFGKDRTGVLCMLIGHMCGQTRQQLIREYAITQEKIDCHPTHFLLSMIKHLKLHDSFQRAHTDTMAKLLDYIDMRYGSVDGYLKTIGFGEEDQKRLKLNIGV